MNPFKSFISRLTQLVQLVRGYRTPDQPDQPQTPPPGRVDPPDFLRSAMVTPFFVLRDPQAVRNIAKQVRVSSNFNSICGLVDLQDGRPYIHRGRTRTQLHPETRRNIQICLDEGVTPLLIIRNDWAVRRDEGMYVPSAGGSVRNHQFYTDAYLDQERQFVGQLIQEFGQYIDIQLSIEPNAPASASFALHLARHTRGLGFSNRLIVNPYAQAVAPHMAIRGQLEDQQVVISRSRNGQDLGDDRVVNTDGNTSINRQNAREWIKRLQDDGRPYILWSRELAATDRAVPREYL